MRTALRNRLRLQLLPQLRTWFGGDVELTLSSKAEALAQVRVCVPDNVHALSVSSKRF